METANSTGTKESFSSQEIAILLKATKGFDNVHTMMMSIPMEAVATWFNAKDELIKYGYIDKDYNLTQKANDLLNGRI